MEMSHILRPPHTEKLDDEGAGHRLGTIYPRSTHILHDGRVATTLFASWSLCGWHQAAKKNYSVQDITFVQFCYI